MQKKPVAILGATGTVGQKMIALLENDPHFYVAEVAASEKSFGKKFSDIVRWREKTLMPKSVGDLTLKDLKEVESNLVVSALPAEIALEIEPFLAEKGKLVFSNASAFRMHEKTPLLIPDINISHLELLKEQKTSGKIITNPNCSTVFLAMGLHPLLKLGNVQHVSVVTLQALSGAGYPGVASLDALNNIVPNIGGEEKKITEEVKKILGTTTTPANFTVTTHVHRVPIHHGHT
ncbi:MAG: aspartate-semialdehyde dehydrogenase, partial [Bacteriovoracaceae bacterium]|nr:aspartate-semialdehyde dehydrogenase [Bacteriovoracaceae bacterium]